MKERNSSRRTSKPAPVETMAAHVVSNPAEMIPEIEQSLKNTLKARHAAGVAQSTFNAVAKETAGIWREAWKAHGVLPSNGKMLDVTINSIKSAAKVKGLDKNIDGEPLSQHEFDGSFSAIANFCYLWLCPNVEIPASKNGEASITVANVGVHQANVKALAAKARETQGTDRKRGPKTPEAAPPSDPSKIGIKQFEVDQESVLALIKRTLSMDSGLGLIKDALKVYGWVVIPTAEKKAELDAATAAMVAKQKAAALAEQEEAKLKAKTRRRSSK